MPASWSPSVVKGRLTGQYAPSYMYKGAHAGSKVEGVMINASRRARNVCCTGARGRVNGCKTEHVVLRIRMSAREKRDVIKRPLCP
jgi:hypothetical protein